jgi:regulator of replication initiation timing
MTYSGIFDEVDLKQVKKLKAEIKKLKKIIDNLETHMNLKDFEIQSLKERLKNEVKTIRSV